MSVRLGAAYLPLHTAMEGFAAVVAAMIFALGCHQSGNRVSCSVIVFSAAFLAVGLLDLGHLLSLNGMPDFVTPNSQSKGIAFWLAARLISASALLLVALLPWALYVDARIRYFAVAGAMTITMLVYWLVLYRPDVVPPLFIEGQGLTTSKIVAEYVVAALYILAAVVLLRRMAHRKAEYLVLAAILMALSEICLTFYHQPDDLPNVVGHIYKIIGCMYLYYAIVVDGMQASYQQLRRSEQSRREHLTHDSLTGLPNRGLAVQRLRDAIVDTGHSGGILAVFFLGIDAFKKINATFGHGVGDTVIRESASRIARVLSAGDMLARQAGDEFIILQTRISDGQRAAQLAEKLLQQMRVPFRIQGHEILLSASIGITLFPADETTESGLLQKAHMAMGSVKRSSRNSYRFHTADMESDIRDQQLMESSLHHAVENDELIIHYQPKVSFKTGEVVGVEALVRWDHPVLGRVAPAAFIPLAEENGCIDAIGMWVLRRACEQSQKWHKQGLPQPRLSVNLSAKQFQQPNLASQIRQVLDDTSLDPNRLELEITESTVMQDIEAAVTALQSLSELGVVLAIDDFGTGYSSLSCLKRFPIDVLKIDRSFIKDISHDTNDAAITRAIIAMARGLDLAVVAEGVETLEQALFLQANGCDEMQGYYFSQPVPSNELAKMLVAPLSVYKKRIMPGNAAH
jgi:diguanylate cyclase (GGDEF)-like protein